MQVISYNTDVTNYLCNFPMYISGSKVHRNPFFSHGVLSQIVDQTFVPHNWTFFRKKTITPLLWNKKGGPSRCLRQCWNIEPREFFRKLTSHIVGRVLKGLGQITWWNLCWQKMRGHIGKKLFGNREIVLVWTVGMWEQKKVWLKAKIGSVLKLIQTQFFLCHVYCAQLGIPWHQIVVASRTVSNRESRYPPCGCPILWNCVGSPMIWKKTWTKPLKPN